MAFSLGALIVDFEARTGKFETDTGRAAALMKKRAAEIDRTLNKFATNIVRYGGAAVAGLSVLIIKNTKEAEAALAQLDAAVKSTGGAAGFTTPELVAMSKALQRTTIFADDAVQAMQSVLLTFTRIRGPEFEAAQQAIVDISSRLGKDLQSSAILVGKALNDPIKGMLQMSKAGIQFSKSQIEAIKNMVAVNDLAGAQGIILGELQKKFGGAAAAARDTFGGALEGLKNAFGDLFEVSADGSNQAKDSILGLTSVLQDPSVVRGVQTLTASIITLIGKIGEAIAGLTILFTGKGGSAAVNLDIQIDKTKSKLDALTQSFGIFDKNRAEQDRILKERFGSGFDTSPLVKQIRELRVEYDKLIEKQQIAQGDIPNPKGGDAGTLPLEKTAEVVLEATEAFEKQSASLKKQIELFGKIGEASKVSYDIASGALEDMHPAEQQHLLALAQQYDALVLQAKAVEDLAKEYEQLGNTTLANRMAIDASRLEQPLAQPGMSVEVGGIQVANQEMTSLAAAVQAVGDNGIQTSQDLDALLLKLGLINDKGEAFKTTLDEMTVFADQAARNIQDSLADFIFDPFDKGLKGMLKGFVDILRRMVAELAASQILKMLSTAVGPASQGGFLGFLSSLFGGLQPKAAGGPVSAGMSYMVGERGPERFVPRVSGSIVPNNALGGLVFAPVNNIHIDSRSDAASVRQETIAIVTEGNRRMLSHLEDMRSRGR